MPRLLKICALLPFLLLAGCEDDPAMKPSDTQAIYKITKVLTVKEVGCTIYDVEFKMKAGSSGGHRYITLSRCATGETSSRVNGNKGAYTDVHNINIDADIENEKAKLDLAIVQQQQAVDKLKAERAARQKLIERLTPEERRLLNIPQ